MPSQLAATKRRHSLNENGAVLAALETLARREKTSVAALLREAARDLLAKRAEASPKAREAMRKAAWGCFPKPPEFRTAAQARRYKRALREFDRAVLETKLETPERIQEINSIVPKGAEIVILKSPYASAS